MTKAKKVDVEFNGKAAAGAQAEQQRAENLAGARRHRGLAMPPYRPFPVEALPQPLRAYCEQAALALGCDVAFVALPALAVAASLIGNTRMIRLKRTWLESLVLWVILIADSGTLKSPAYQMAVSYLFKLQRRLLLSYKQELAQFDEKLAEWKEAKRRHTKENGPDPGDQPDPPKLQRVVLSDVTIEKLAEVLEDNPRGTFVARDELAGWLGSFTRYKGKQGGSDLPLWLEAHQAGSWLVDRKGGERRHYYVPRAAVSVAGGIQPGVLARVLTGDFLDAGLAARLLMAMPPKLPKRWTEAEIDPETESDYHNLLDRLKDLEFDKDKDGATPHVLKLSPEAYAAWVEFYNQWAQQQLAAEGEMAAALSKLERIAARLALLHHVVTHVGLQSSDLRPIGLASVQAGIALCRWFADEARRVYLLLAESEEQHHTRRLVEFIRSRGGQITARLLQRSNDRKYPAAETAEAALDALVQAGLGAWTEPRSGPSGGQPARWFFLRPTPDSTDTTDEGDDDPPPAAPDSPTDTTRPNHQNSSVSEGSVGSVRRQAQDKAGTQGGAAREEGDGGSVGRDGSDNSDAEEHGDAWEGD